MKSPLDRWTANVLHNRRIPAGIRYQLIKAGRFRSRLVRWDAGGVPFPSDITGLYARYVADDSGLANGASADTVPDLSGNARNLSRTAGTVTYVSNVVNGRGVIRAVSGGKLSLTPWFDATVSARGCVVGVMKANTASAEPMWDGTASWWCNTATISPQGWVFNSAVTTNRDPVSPNGHYCFHHFWDNISSAVTYPAGTGTWQTNINHRDVTASNGVAAHSANGRILEMPRSGGVEYAELCFFSRRPTWTELFRLNAYFAAKYGTPAVADLTGCVCYLGNSTTQAVTRYASADMVSRNAAVFNFGISSGTITTMNSQQTELLEVLNYFRSRGKKAVVYCHHGHNNGYGSTTNPATNNVVRHFTGADGSTLFAAIRATGAKLLLIGPSIWGGWASLSTPHTGGTEETYRVALRNWINTTAVSGGFADAVYDLGATAEFGVYGEGPTPTGGTSHGDFPLLWSDNVHQTAAGEQAKATLIASAVQALYDAA